VLFLVRGVKGPKVKAAATEELIRSAETYCILGYDPGTKPAWDLIFQRAHPKGSSKVLEGTPSFSAFGAKDLDYFSTWLSYSF
jgi:hypothetical protein